MPPGPPAGSLSRLRAAERPSDAGASTPPLVGDVAGSSEVVAGAGVAWGVLVIGATGAVGVAVAIGVGVTLASGARTPPDRSCVSLTAGGVDVSGRSSATGTVVTFCSFSARTSVAGLAFFFADAAAGAAADAARTGVSVDGCGALRTGAEIGAGAERAGRL